jgi:hypothetical protein
MSMAAKVAIVTDSAPQFFEHQLARAKLERHCETSDIVDAYLVALLVDHVLPSRRMSLVYDRSIVLLLAEALSWHGAKRLRRLRMLGDAVLFTSGFFEERLVRAGTDPEYVQGLGARAYAEAGRTLKVAGRHVDASRVPDLFAELSDAFPALVEVIREIAFSLEANVPHDELGTLSLYERWLATGSTTLAHALAERGVVPIRETSSPTN